MKTLKNHQLLPNESQGLMVLVSCIFHSCSLFSFSSTTTVVRHSGRILSIVFIDRENYMRTHIVRSINKEIGSLTLRARRGKEMYDFFQSSNRVPS
jgi:hypothetical protein